MSLPKYPHYKPSGVEWLGDVPRHWDVTRLKFLLSSMGSGGTPDTDNQEYWVEGDEGIPWVAIGDLSDRPRVEFTSKRLTASGLDSKRLTVWPVGTLLFSMYASLGHTALLSVPAATNQAILALLPSDAVVKQYLVRWLEFLKPKLKEQASSNTQDNLNAEKVRNLVAMCPPVEEQTTIAAFLDHETAKIDALIAEQAKLIALLAEKRQATISHAVTRGLDPAAPMKDSGVAWLGEVPAHWAVLRVRHAVVIDNSLRLPINREDRSEMVGHYPYWGPTGIIDYIDEFRYEGERALIGEDGDHFTKYSIWPMTQWATGQFNVNNHAHVISDGPKCTAKWFYFSFLHRDIGSDLIAQGVSRLKLTREGLSNLWLAAPPLEEQTLIMKFIEQEMARLVQLQNESERAIALLKERRAALIAAAVTGQIDVRGWRQG
ncbi:restriction endonuclease subunit S [Sphaerotilus natans]|uniref:restriction endonuclease subunit S n=1 Tax=Sphaerotilus natans TaxID=34103 RepID=UPI00406CE2D8